MNRGQEFPARKFDLLLVAITAALVLGCFREGREPAVVINITPNAHVDPSAFQWSESDRSVVDGSMLCNVSSRSIQGRMSPRRVYLRRSSGRIQSVLLEFTSGEVHDIQKWVSQYVTDKRLATQMSRDLDKLTFRPGVGGRLYLMESDNTAHGELFVVSFRVIGTFDQEMPVMLHVQFYYPDHDEQPLDPEK